MTKDDSDGPKSLIAVDDLLGLSGATNAFVDALVLGVGKVLAPWQSRRETKAQIENFNDWSDALAARGYASAQTELSLTQRAEVRLLADTIKHQRNREAVAWQAIEQVKIDEELPTDDSIPFAASDWIDRFWRISESVSDKEIQSFLGVVLARRTKRKSNFSMRALEFLTTLSGDEARDLERMAQFTVKLKVNESVSFCGIMYAVSDLNNAEASEVKEKLKIIKEKINVAQRPMNSRHFGSIGVFVEDGWAASFVQSLDKGYLEFCVADTRVKVTSGRDEIRLGKVDQHGFYRIGSGIEIAPLGIEIFDMLRPTANKEYLALLTEAFEAKGLNVEIFPSR